MPHKFGGHWAALMRPEELVDRARALIDGDPEGTVFFLGTIAGKMQIDFADVFECELEDPATGDTIVCAYRAEPLSWFNGTI